jgi:hypothetical protein
VMCASIRVNWSGSSAPMSDSAALTRCAMPPKGEPDTSGQIVIWVFTCLHRPLLLGGDQRFKGGRFDLDGVLGKAEEEFTA